MNPMVRTVSLKIVPPSDIEKLSYDEKNALLKREMSPHLTIYRPQLTSMLSISHRFTGTLVDVGKNMVDHFLQLYSNPQVWP